MKKLFSLLFLLGAFTLFAQEAEQKKVGLVLSGGGAKGLAHIGVLKVLEEAGVKVDYIGGTSMGAIIGSLYASGYTATELDSIFRTVDADALLQDYVPRISKSFYEKRNDEIYAIQLPFDHFKLGMPAALSKGMYNYNLISRLLAHVRYERDFSKLPIPFVCIATELETGKLVVLNSGILPQAVLASGAFPSLYSPVEIDGKILIDGGITDNYPIDEVRKMGADIIIGVDVQDGLRKSSDIKAASDVLMQISNFSLLQDMERKIRETDFHIQPDISKFSVVSFVDGREIIKNGEKAALEYFDDFVKLGKKEYVNNPPHYVEKYTGKINISKIKISQLESFTDGYVFGKLKMKPCQTVSLNNLTYGIDNLNGTQNFSTIAYSFEADEEEENSDIMHLILKESAFQRYLKLGVHYNPLYKSAALVNVTQKKLIFKNDVISLDLGFGDNFRYHLNYYVDNGYSWSVGAQSRLHSFGRNIAQPQSEGARLMDDLPRSMSLEYLDITNRVYFQTFYKERFLVGVGLEHKFNQIDIRNIILPRPWLDKSHYFSAYGNIIFDTYDNKYFPRRGILFNAEYKNYFHSSDYNNNFSNFSQITGELGVVKTFFNKLSVELKGDIGVTIGTESSPFLNYFFGGYGFQSVYNIKPFYGYDFLSVFDDSFIKGMFRLDYEIFLKHHINFSGNYAQIGKNIFSYPDWISKPQFSGYALGYGYQTIIGPIEIKYSWSPETRNSYTWVSVGFWF